VESDSRKTPLRLPASPQSGARAGFAIVPAGGRYEPCFPPTVPDGDERGKSGRFHSRSAGWLV